MSPILPISLAHHLQTSSSIAVRFISKCLHSKIARIQVKDDGYIHIRVRLYSNYFSPITHGISGGAASSVGHVNSPMADWHMHKHM